MVNFLAGQRLNWKSLVFWLLVLVLAGVLTALFWNYTQDDVYITYAYSRNIAEGQGFVFNHGERVQGTTTPLYTLLMAVPALLHADLFHIGNLLSIVFLMVTAWLGWNLLKDSQSIPARWSFVLTAVVSPLVYVSLGMETLLYAMLLMLSFWLWKAGRLGLAMLVAAALTWTRAGGVMLGGTLGLLALLDRWQARDDHAAGFSPLLRAVPWKLWLIYVLGIAPWFIFAWFYFGSPLPNTFGAKQEMLHGLKFWSDGWGWWQAFYGNNWLSLVAVPLVLLGLWRAFRTQHLRPVALWAVLYAAGYTALNVTAFWYYTPWVLVLTLLAAVGGDWLARQVAARWISRRMVRIASLALVVLSAGLAVQAAAGYGVPPQRVATYTLAGQWIEAHTPPDATLLLGDLGIVGYHADRLARDVPGLIVPDMYAKQENYAVLKYRTDLVFATGYFTWQHATGQDWFGEYYRPLARLSTAGDHDFSPMTVYQRRWPTTIPAQVFGGGVLPLTCEVALGAGVSLPETTTAQLLDASGAVLVEASQPFLRGQYPRDVTLGEEKLVEQITLVAAVPPGTYQWTLACDRVLTGTVEVLPPDAGEGYVLVQAGLWVPFARLRGFLMPEGEETWSGGVVTLALDWAALAPADQDYSVFVHMVDAGGNIVAQTDGYPAGGTRPSSQWVADERILDVREIDVPADLPEGAYALVLGWYDWRTGDRIPLADGADALRLPVQVTNRWPGGSGLP